MYVQNDDYRGRLPLHLTLVHLKQIMNGYRPLHFCLHLGLEDV
jgi:hypothetical protein